MCERERDLLQVCERDTPYVRQPVLPVVPATVRQVNPSDEGHRLVNDDDLLVMRPQVDRGGDVVRVTHHLWGHSQTLRQETSACGLVNRKRGQKPTLMLG